MSQWNRAGFLRRSAVLLQTKNPFEALGITKSASKAQVKSAYRQLAKAYHPDASGGDSKKMEQINQAYKFLMKEGGYDLLQRGKGGPHHKGKKVAHPFSEDTKSEKPSLSDEEMEKWSALDPSTERRTPSGKFMYQSRDDQSWVELDRPLIRADQPRYASFAAQADFVGELRRRQLNQEKEQNEKSAFQRNMDKLAGSADLPSRNPYFLRFYALLLLVFAYMAWVRTFARQAHQKQRNIFYADTEDKREQLLLLYDNHTLAVENAAAAATLVLLAAAKKKEDTSSQIVVKPPVLVYDAVRPPASHFHVIAGG